MQFTNFRCLKEINFYQERDKEEKKEGTTMTFALLFLPLETSCISNGETPRFRHLIEQLLCIFDNIAAATLSHLTSTNRCASTMDQTASRAAEATLSAFSNLWLHFQNFRKSLWQFIFLVLVLLAFELDFGRLFDYIYI